jgi:cold shock CspA family protein
MPLKPGRYKIQHRTDGPDHFVHFTEVTKTGSTVAHPGEVKCRLETLDDKVPYTAVYTRQEGTSARVTKVLIGGENVAHLF